MADLHVNGTTYTASPMLVDNEQLSLELRQALREWYEQKGISLLTSGSTGAPSRIEHPHQRLIASIEKTCAYFELSPGDSALLCLPIDKIAGRMMLYRALHMNLSLHIQEATSTPFKSASKKYDFVALTPHQVTSSLASGSILREHAEKLIIGGAPVSHKLESALLHDGVYAWETYGMTETVTHIAVRQLSPQSQAVFTCLEGVTVSTTDDHHLIIEADHLNGPLLTTDVVDRIDKHHFRWVGRADHAINSGGLKIHPESIEAKVAHLFDRRYYFSGESDEVFGQRVVLNIEGSEFRESEEEELIQGLINHLKKYELPKKIVYQQHFKETTTGKIIRL